MKIIPPSKRPSWLVSSIDRQFCNTTNITKGSLKIPCDSLEELNLFSTNFI